MSDEKVGKLPDHAMFTGLLVFLWGFFLALCYENFQTVRKVERRISQLKAIFPGYAINTLLYLHYYIPVHLFTAVFTH